MPRTTTELPTTWGQDEVSGGNSVLLGFADCSVHLVAPPGSRFKLDEPDEERANWRHAVWHVESHEEIPVVSIDAPDVVVGLSTSEVVDLLPIDHHDFVRAAMARQLCRAISFGKPPSGACPDEEDARIAGRTLAWVNQELSDAFPAEGWFRQERPSVRMPNTVEECLERFKEDQSRPYDEAGHLGVDPVSRSHIRAVAVLTPGKSSYVLLIVWALIGSLTSYCRSPIARSLENLRRVPTQHTDSPPAISSGEESCEAH